MVSRASASLGALDGGSHVACHLKERPSPMSLNSPCPLSSIKTSDVTC